MTYYIDLCDAAGIRKTYGPFDTHEKALGAFRWLSEQYRGTAIPYLYDADIEPEEQEQTP